MQVKPDVDVPETQEIIQKSLGTETFVLLDVRTPDEYRAGHIEGSTHIQLQTLENHLPKLNKNAYYVIYCRSGVRSKTAANLMKLKGFGRVSNMLGGIIAWSAAKLPTVMGK